MQLHGENLAAIGKSWLIVAHNIWIYWDVLVFGIITELKINSVLPKESKKHA